MTCKALDNLPLACLNPILLLSIVSAAQFLTSPHKTPIFKSWHRVMYSLPLIVAVFYQASGHSSFLAAFLFWLTITAKLGDSWQFQHTRGQGVLRVWSLDSRSSSSSSRSRRTSQLRNETFRLYLETRGGTWQSVFWLAFHVILINVLSLRITDINDPTNWLLSFLKKASDYMSFTFLGHSFLCHYQ